MMIDEKWWKMMKKISRPYLKKMGRQLYSAPGHSNKSMKKFIKKYLPASISNKNEFQELIN